MLIFLSHLQECLRAGMAGCMTLLVMFIAPTYAADKPSAKVNLRVVGGLAGGNLFPRFEQPFWEKTLPVLSKGEVTAEIVPFDRSGLRTNEVLRLVKLGVVPFGTMLMGGILEADPELAAADLAGLNPDMASLRRSLAAFRPHLEKVMRERHGIETLAIYVYPAQVTFCSRAFANLSDLSGRRVRISNPSQADLLRPFGAIPLQMEFSQVLGNMRSGNVDCAITGAMTGNTIGLADVASHISARATTWGLSVFGANMGAWQALPPNVRALISAELPKLEQAIWADAEAITQEGVSCNVGRSACVSGKPGRMKEVISGPADEQKLKEAFRTSVLPAWVDRCADACVQVWNQILAPVTGIRAEGRSR
jgi:TRAP-type C4-dicarboxylate transport system substrate-binding protein